MEDFIDIGTIMPINVFDRELAVVSQKFIREHKPFDEQCARLDFRDKLETAEKESERKYGFINIKEVNENMKREYKDLDRYADADRFELVSEEDTYGDKLSDDGKKTQGMIGYTMSYKCKQRGHGIAVFIPLEGKKIVEYKEMKGNKKEK